MWLLGEFWIESKGNIDYLMEVYFLIQEMQRMIVN